MTKYDIFFFTKLCGLCDWPGSGLTIGSLQQTRDISGRGVEPTLEGASVSLECTREWDIADSQERNEFVISEKGQRSFFPCLMSSSGGRQLSSFNLFWWVTVQGCQMRTLFVISFYSLLWHILWGRKERPVLWREALSCYRWMHWSGNWLHFHVRKSTSNASDDSIHVNYVNCVLLESK